MGANDHSSLGYLLTLTLLGAMLPVGFGGDAVLALVDVDALAEGLCLATERAPMGENYLFCGERSSLRDVFKLWGQETSRLHGAPLVSSSGHHAAAAGAGPGSHCSAR